MRTDPQRPVPRCWMPWCVQFLAYAPFCGNLAESLNNPRVLAWSDDCLFSLPVSCWARASLRTFSATSAAPEQVMKPAGEESSKEPAEKIFQQCWQMGFFYSVEKISSRYLLALYPRWDCLDSAPFKHSCTRKISGLAAEGHLVYFACTMTLKMGRLHKACQVFQVGLVPRPRTHLW